MKFIDHLESRPGGKCEPLHGIVRHLFLREHGSQRAIAGRDEPVDDVERAAREHARGRGRPSESVHGGGDGLRRETVGGDFGKDSGV